MGLVAGLLAIVYTLAATGNDRPGNLDGLLRFREDGRGVTVYGIVLIVLGCASVVLTAGTLSAGGRERRLGLAANVVIKLTLLAAVVFMLAFPNLSQFEGKSLTYRAILYPALSFLVPALYSWRRIDFEYPVIPDLCLSFTLCFDIVSNDLLLWHLERLGRLRPLSQLYPSDHLHHLCDNGA